MAVSVPAVRALTKTELIHAQLRQGILTLQYRPGEYLNVDALARQHHLSPIPVREAVARLVAERLVAMRPHIGAEVAPLDETSVREVFALLEGLESAAATCIVEKNTAPALVELAAIVDRMEEMQLPRDLSLWDAANASFHLKLAAVAELPSLLDHLRVVFDHWDRIRRFFFHASSARGVQRAHREHRAMLKALAKKDGNRLRELVHEHNERARRFYLKLLASQR